MRREIAPIYIPSKGRADSRLTVRALDRMKVPYHVVIEASEFAAYSEVIDRDRLLVLDPAYQRDYDACDSLGFSKPKGSGPARNFAWDHARSRGADWHWTIDDNIKGFFRLNYNLKVEVTSSVFFEAMEDFVDRYKNVAMAGPNYFMFASRKTQMPPLTFNTRIYSCNLIKTPLPYRWRARYNEDTDLSLRLLKDGWCTVLFNALLQYKTPTLSMKGGNTDSIYVGGTAPKSQMIARLHPDVARVVWRFHRVHHHVDYRPFRTNKLIRRTDLPFPEGVEDYGMRLVRVGGSEPRHGHSRTHA